MYGRRASICAFCPGQQMVSLSLLWIFRVGFFSVSSAAGLELLGDKDWVLCDPNSIAVCSAWHKWLSKCVPKSE